MVRRLFKVLVLLSLVLLVATVVLWVLSYARPGGEEFRWQGRHRGVALESYRGTVGLRFTWWVPPWEEPSPSFVRHGHASLLPMKGLTIGNRFDEPGPLARAGFGSMEGWSTTDGKGQTLAEHTVWYAPYWFAAAVFALAPALSVPAVVKGRTRRRRLTRNRCLHCGYDLTGNVSGTCPECGKAVSGGAP